MPVQIVCAHCGKSHNVTPTELARGAKYCSIGCAREGRKETGPERLTERLGVPMTRSDMIALNARAERENIALASLAREFILAGLVE